MISRNRPFLVFFFMAILSMFVGSGCSLFQPDSDNSFTGLLSSEPKKEWVPTIRKRVLIANILNKSKNGGEDLTRWATNYVKDYLAKNAEFSYVLQNEISDTDHMVDDYGEYDVKKVIAVARAQNLSGILLGSIQDLSFRESSNEAGLFRTREFSVIAKIKIQLIDTGTERMIMNQTNTAEVTEEHTDFFKTKRTSAYDPERAKTALLKAMEKSLGPLPELMKKIAWVGRIAHVEQHRYFVNAGELTGINLGHLLKVYEEGKIIRDPDTQTIIGMAPGRFKGLLKVVDYFGQDGAIAIVHSGGGFRQKDHVELYIGQKN